MRHDCARGITKRFSFNGHGNACASARRLLTLGVALASCLAAAGCIGLTGSPGAGGSGGGTGSSSGSQASQLSPSSAQVAFGNVTVGSSTSQLVTLTAAGNSNVTITSVTASGTGFSVSGPSNVILAPNQSLTISVGFQPKATGSATGKLVVSSNASNSSMQIALSGYGLAAGGNHSVALNWQASTSPVIGYFVFRGSTAANLSQMNVNAVASTSYTDRNVVNGHTYVYAVKSMDASNLLSSFSNTVTVTVPNQ
jgi:Cep192 domain 4